MSLTSRLRERVRIEYPMTTNDEYGGKVIAWAELAKVFAEVTAVPSAITEHMIGQQRQSSAGYRVTMRYRADVTAAMRLVWKTHTLMIHSLHESDFTLNILSYEENV